MKLLASLLMLPVFVTGFLSFSDVSDDHPNMVAIDYVQDEGIVDGYDDGTYKPDAQINRAEFTKIIVEAWFEVEDESTDPSDLNFTDLDDDWYVPYIRVAYAEGLIDGYDDGSFKPADKINFVEAAKIISEASGSDLVSTEIWYIPYMYYLEGLGALPPSISSLDHELTRGEMAELILRLREEITDFPSLTYDIIEGSPIYTEYTEELYDTLLGNRPFVLYYHADWCPTCVALEDYITENMDSFEDGTIFLAVDYDEELELRQEYGIVTQYTFVILDDVGEATDTLTTNNVAWVRQAINYTLE
jgi:thiol-disulfide isomerase/thioredoxin